MYLHPVLIGIFLLILAALAVVGGIRLVKERHFGMAVFLLITMVVFGASAYSAFTV